MVQPCFPVPIYTAYTPLPGRAEEEIRTRCPRIPDATNRYDGRHDGRPDGRHPSFLRFSQSVRAATILDESAPLLRDFGRMKKTNRPEPDRYRAVRIVVRWSLQTLVAASLFWVVAHAWAEDHSSGLWSLQAVRRTPIPMLQSGHRPREGTAARVSDSRWAVDTWIDAFVLQKLEERGLEPGQAADRAGWLRRATFDLTGLPPSDDEGDELVADPAPDAKDRAIDRLLASPAYGQRWGRHWLDAVRYADARDLIQLPAESDFREIWRYRDWVVSAWNRDMPYPQFLTMQLAGDLLQPQDDDRIDRDALVATGFLALADFVPGDVDKEQMIADYVNDEIDVVGRAILGFTLACARCHDHKFDPITTEDYYALAGIFFSTRLVPGPVKGNTPLVRVPLASRAELARIESEKIRNQQRMAELRREISSAEDRHARAYLEQQVALFTEKYLIAAWEFTRWQSQNAEADLLLDLEPTADVVRFAADRSLDPATLARWLSYLHRRRGLRGVGRVHPSLENFLALADQESVARASSHLQGVVRDNQRARGSPVDPATEALQRAELLRFQADDSGIITDASGAIEIWPDRAGLAEDAERAADLPTPMVSVESIHGRSRSVVQFQGKQLLHAPRTVPNAGTIVICFRCDSKGPDGQRLIGWEDASAGQHGIGLMVNGRGALHAILRKQGANGDVVCSAPPQATFQTVTITWGQDGTAVYRDGELLGSNRGTDGVSSDPAIKSLVLGGPGSGGGGRFHGDLAEFRVYDRVLAEADRKQVEQEVRTRWFDNDQPPGEKPKHDGSDRDGVARQFSLRDELLSSRGPYRIEKELQGEYLSAEARAERNRLQQELQTLEAYKPYEVPQAVVVQEGGPKETPHEGTHDAKVFARGNPHQPGDVVPRGFPAAIQLQSIRPLATGNSTSIEISDNSSSSQAAKAPASLERYRIREGSGRRELAGWITDPAHPLTARVMVNRIWQHHFGVGLVPTSTNFGALGERPSHPELLDELAARYIESGWSAKRLHRWLVLSSTYGRSSRVDAVTLRIDPENRWLARMSRRRLDAEEIRDAMLAVSYELDRKTDGPGFLELANPRRSLYLMSARTGAKTSDFAPLFDGANCGAIVERRASSTVAPQALFLMNDPWVEDLANRIAVRLLSDVRDPDLAQRIGRLYQRVLSRAPTAEELEIAHRFLDDASKEQVAAGPEKRIDKQSVEAWARLCHLLLCTNEFVYVD